MQVWSLSSGSCGNCYVVREGDTVLLMEAGLSATRVEHEIARLGLAPSAVAAILASHEHSDHWSAAVALSRRTRAPLLCSPGTWLAAEVTHPSVAHESLLPGRPLQVGSLTVQTFPLPHDAREPVGFLLRSSVAALCLATDMGIATEETVEQAREADLVILESNHDVEMVVRGPYPAHLKARILGDRGHLSNEEAGRAVARIAVGRRPQRFWLAHLSHTNNSPRAALSTVRDTLNRQGLSHLRVEVALRDRRSLFWDSEAELPLEQLRLF